jgi:hypothetical protein
MIQLVAAGVVKLHGKQALQPTNLFGLWRDQDGWLSTVRNPLSLSLFKASFITATS